MKKILLGLLALSSISFAQKDIYLNARVGGDLAGRYTEFTSDGKTVLSDKTDGFGGEIALEGYMPVTDNLDLGLGLAYQIHADRKSQNVEGAKVSGAEYKSLPVYLIAKYNFNLDSQIKPYLKANLGYSFNFDSSDIEIKGIENKNIGLGIDDGLYAALGGGVEYNNFTLDLMYAINTAEIKNDYDNKKDDNDYGRFVLSAGYRFNL